MKKINKRQVVFHEFPPFYNEESTVLILGSIPSVKSREQGFYYGHPQNRFWKVLSAVFNAGELKSVEDRKNFLWKNNIALWDVLESCEIESSSDSSIKNPIVNDVRIILGNSKVEKIFVTGKKAYDLYNKYIYPVTNRRAIYLPSTSSANGAFTLNDLIEEYKKIRK